MVLTNLLLFATPICQIPRLFFSKHWSVLVVVVVHVVVVVVVVVVVIERERERREREMIIIIQFKLTGFDSPVQLLRTQKFYGARACFLMIQKEM